MLMASSIGPRGSGRGPAGSPVGRTAASGALWGSGLRTGLSAAWSVLRHGITVYAWALGAYTAAVLVHALTGIDGGWVLLPAAPLAGLGALRWIWQGERGRVLWRLGAVAAAAAGLALTSLTAYSHGLALAGVPQGAGLLGTLPPSAAAAGALAVPVGSVLRAFTELVALPAAAVAAAGTAFRLVRRLPLNTGPVPAPSSLPELALDGAELLVWLVATPAAFLAGANLADTTPGLAQPAGALLAFAALPFGAYGFLRVLWCGLPSRDLATFLRKALLVLLLAAVGAVTLSAALPALNSLRAAAGLGILAVWAVACAAMCWWRRRRVGVR